MVTEQWLRSLVLDRHKIAGAQVVPLRHGGCWSRKRLRTVSGGWNFMLNHQYAHEVGNRLLDITEMGGRPRALVRINFFGKGETLFRGLRRVCSCLSEYKGLETVHFRVPSQSSKHEDLRLCSRTTFLSSCSFDGKLSTVKFDILKEHYLNLRES